ncbi:MAG TPA: helix-turn-helix domain-containing protein [Bryobacteraceae bacterium]|nr:helix-turn-helix domain-containing protein [Bryobacteraceae bacterium]
MTYPAAPTSVTDAIAHVIERAVDVGVRKALNLSEATNRRLLSIEESALYLSLSKREVYNMIAVHELPVVPRGRKKMIDLQDLNSWIERNKR